MNTSYIQCSGQFSSVYINYSFLHVVHYERQGLPRKLLPNCCRPFKIHIYLRTSKEKTWDRTYYEH